MAHWAYYSEKDPLWIPFMAPLSSFLSQVEDLIFDRVLEHTQARQRLLMVENICPSFVFHVPEQDIGRTSEVETFPVIFNTFGGAYVLGCLDHIETESRRFCRDHRAVVVSISYGLAPERPWPAAQNDVFESCKWIVQHAHEFNGNIQKGFILLGLSSGGCLVAIAAQRARTDPVLAGKITGQIFIMPTFYKLLSPPPEKYKSIMLSYGQNRDDPTYASPLWAITDKIYGAGDAEDPEVSPLMAESFKDLPPSAFLVAGADCLRDEALLYAQLSAEAGVPVKVEVYKGFGHGFNSIGPQLEASKKLWRDFDESLKWILSLAPQPVVAKI